LDFFTRLTFALHGDTFKAATISFTHFLRTGIDFSLEKKVTSPLL
jgi:hypothetical protein